MNPRDTREKREKKIQTTTLCIYHSPLGKSSAKSATCVFALVTLSFAIKMRPRTEFENRSDIVGPLRGTFFMPNFSNCFVDWSTWRIDFASSLIAINEAYGGGSSSSSSSTMIFFSYYDEESAGVGGVYSSIPFSR